MNRIRQHSDCQWKMQWNTFDLSELEPMFITCWQIRSTLPVLELYNFCHHRLRHLSIFPVHLISGTNASQLSCLSSSASVEGTISAIKKRQHHNVCDAIVTSCTVQVRSYQTTFSFKFFPFQTKLFPVLYTPCTNWGRRLRNFVCAFENLWRSTISSDASVRLFARMEQIDLVGFFWNFVLWGWWGWILILSRQFVFV